jgi:hypothetical protein
VGTIALESLARATQAVRRRCVCYRRARVHLLWAVRSVGSSCCPTLRLCSHLRVSYAFVIHWLMVDADAATKAWLTKALDPVFGFPSLVRFSWQTCETILDSDGVKVDWYAPCRVLSCPVVSCRVLSCPVVSCRVLSCPVVSCRVMSCRVLSCAGMLADQGAAVQGR